MPGSWTSVRADKLSAFDELHGIGMTATTNPASFFSTLVENRFPFDGGWEADHLAMSSSVLGWGTTSVNAGDHQRFGFDIPRANGHVDSEHFDSSTRAMIRDTGKLR